ncbi:TPA: SAM-dependent methyltransferase [Escherichia coli]|nr:SAM-dependent methyltransferase [Escherichia coli]
MTTQSHHDHVEKQFSSQACEYLTSTVHASGRDLQRLAVRLADYPGASVLVIWAAEQGMPALSLRKT